MTVDVLSAVYAAARTVHHKYYNYTELEDLQQEAYVWMLGHQAQIDRHLEADVAKVSEYRILRDASMALEKYARACKASLSGYEPADESWYSKGILALVLPHVLSGNREGPQAALDGLPRARNDPAHGNTFAAMFVDVSKALATLSNDEIHLLVDRYHDELTFDQIADRYGWGSSSTAQSHVRKAEGHLIDALGGREPKGCDGNGCACWEHDERLRRRPGKGDETW